MTVKLCLLLAVFIGLAWKIPIAGCQISQSVPFPSKSDSCNVVQCSCGADRQQKEESQTRNPGAPGKMGPVGLAGPKGERGIKGEGGSKGERGEDADKRRINEIVSRMLSATSCQELNEVHGVIATGYYPLRDNRTSSIVSFYCDFAVYEDVTDCAELFSSHGMSTHGFYRFPDRLGEVPSYHHCADHFTCHQLQNKNRTLASGYYRLGLAGDSYQVWCEFGFGPAITKVSHDSTKEFSIPACEDRGCYSKVPRYDLAKDKILKIMEQSGRCRQYIKYRCQGSMILREIDAWWVSREGEKMIYWGGATSMRNKYCACGETGECINNSYKCNCDNNSGNIMTQDEGYLTDKKTLPVKEMRFGDLGHNNEHGWHTLGKLECMD
uniref:contactin-associated protein-like 5 n=1 Tax=Styela clava TaxID=7725 RepID=UPI00193AB056|nr:contactin-associated protein-like 5 [Styela clava]